MILDLMHDVHDGVSAAVDWLVRTTRLDRLLTTTPAALPLYWISVAVLLLAPLVVLRACALVFFWMVTRAADLASGGE